MGILNLEQDHGGGDSGCILQRLCNLLLLKTKRICGQFQSNLDA